MLCKSESREDRRSEDIINRKGAQSSAFPVDALSLHDVISMSTSEEECLGAKEKYFTIGKVCRKTNMGAKISPQANAYPNAVRSK